MITMHRQRPQVPLAVSIRNDYHCTGVSAAGPRPVCVEMQQYQLDPILIDFHIPSCVTMDACVLVRAFPSTPIPTASLATTLTTR
jgi:hypothetical protein